MLAVVIVVVVLLLVGAPVAYGLARLGKLQAPYMHRAQRADRYYDPYTHTWRLKSGHAATSKPPGEEP